MNKNPNENQAFSEEYSDIFSSCIDMLKLMKRHLVTVITIVIICTVGALGFSILKYEPIYKTNVTFSITPLVLSDSQSGLSVYKFNYVSSFAEQMNKTFPHIIESDNLRDNIAYNLGRRMNGKIIAEPITGSNIFKVTVESNSAKDANDIMNSFIECYPGLAEHIIGDTRIKVIHSNGMPEKPSNSPNHLIHTLLGTVIGLIISMAIFFVYGMNRETVKDKTDITTKLNSHYICEIPHVSKKRNSNNSSKSSLLKVSAKNPGFSEAIRVLRKRVKALLRENEKIIAITSTTVGEGKTTVAYNFAGVLASGGERTLLIDMDLIRKTLQNQLLKDPNKCLGLTDVAVKNADLKKAICPVAENFDILFAGSADCKFNNKKFRKIFEDLRKEYQYIIVDIPACGVVSDVALITDLCDNIIFTVKSDETAISSIKRALQYILYSKARLIGFVLNNRGASSGSYGPKSYYSSYKRYGYRYRYGRGYSYGAYGIDSVRPEK